MNRYAVEPLEARQERYREVTRLLGEGKSLRQVGVLLGLSYTRVAQIRDAGEPQDNGRPMGDRDPEETARLIALWTERADKRRAAGLDDRYAMNRVKALEAGGGTRR